MKIKIIDILNTIANNEQPPKKILFRGSIFEYANLQQDYYSQDAKEWLFDEYVLLDILNYEVIILETTITYNQDNIENSKQDKIEKFMFTISKNRNKRIEQDIINLGIKINEIIDRVNKLL